MAYFRCGGGGIPSSLKSGMNDVLNKKFGTSTTYPPSDWPSDVNLLGPLPTKTASGAIASFSDGADDVPISEGTFYIAPSQSGTGTPSPSNPRPIVGYTDMTIQQTGKNLLHNEMEDGTTGGIDYSLNSDGSIDCSGKVTNVNSTRVLATNIKLPAGSYVLSGATNSIRLRCMIYNKDGTYTSRNDSGSGVTCSITTDTDYIEFRVRASTLNEVIDTTIYPMFEVGSTPSQFEAFKSKTPITISLGRTIYGGSVDVVQGTGTDGYSGLVALNSKQWNKTTVSGHTAFYCSLSDGYMVTGADNFDGACSSYDVTTDTTLANDKVIRFYYNSSYNISRAIIRDDQYENLTGAEFQAVVTGNMIYMLNEASETPFTFTPTPINSYLGDNNIWCDSGDTEVTYRADIQLALNA